MGQTLTHGVYLPDEGERNCYSGLAGNWTILDGAVGTVAQHTTALAGKAPAVHTHTKSDITDLLNSNFIPSANNSYDLGSSSYQWNNLYAKNYYYNGVAWGLDKVNLWSGTNQFYNSVDYRDPVFSGKNPPSTYRAVDTFKHLGNDNTYWGGLKHNWLTDGYSSLQICIANHRLVNDVWTQGFWAINFAASKDFSDVSFYPSTNNSINLGTSTNKWKSLNGINPGALSLPDLTSNGYIELSNNISANTEYSYTPPADGWLALYVLTTGFHVENAVGIFNGSSSGNAHRLACSATSGINLARSNYYHGAVILPVIAGIPYLCWIKIDSSTTLAGKVLYFYKAAGNV